MNTKKPSVFFSEDFKESLFFNPFLQCTLEESERVFLSVVYGGELVKLESKHTRLVVKMTGSDGI